MINASFLGLLQNAALLLAVAFIFDLVAARERPGRASVRQAGVGLALGAIGIIIMLTPWTFTPGIVFDTRSILIGLSGLFFGTLATAIAMAMTAAFRFYQGGIGSWTGIAVILASGVIGILWRHFRRQSLADISMGELYLLGIVIHLTMLTIMLTLPWEIALRVLSKITLPVLLIYPPGTVMLGALMVKRLRRELADQRLVESEEKYRRMVETANEGVWAMDGEFKTTFVNERMADMLGYETEEMLGRRVDSFMHPEDLEDHLKKMTSRIQGRDAVYERRFLRKDGATVWTIVSATVLRDPQGNFSGSFAMFTDVTESRLAETRLKEAYDIINRSPAVVFLWKNSEGWPVEIVTDNVEILFGYKAEAFTSGEISYAATVHPDDLGRVAREVADYSREKSRLSFDHDPYRILTKDGKTKWVNDSTVIRRNDKGEITHYQGILFDITERKRSEAARQESELKYRTLVETSRDLIYTTDRKGFLTYANPALEKILGYKTDELQGISFAQITAPEFISKARDIFRRSMKGEHIPVYEADFIRKDGTRVSMEVNTTNLFDADGKPSGRYGIGRDITERKKSEKERREYESRLASIIDFLPDATLVIDREGKVVAWNRAMEDMTGVMAEDMLGKGDYEYALPFYGERRPVLIDLVLNPDEEIQKKYIQIDRGDIVLRGESCIPAFRGGETHLIGTASALRDSEGNIAGAIESIRDVTERRKMEAMLRKSEERYKELFENISGGVAVYEAVEDGENFVFRQFNKAGERIENIRREEVLGKKVTLVFPGIVEMGLFDVFQRVWRTGIPEHYPVSIYRDGRITGWRENYIYKLPSGEIVAVYDDVTPRKAAEEALRRSEEKYRSIFENALEGIYQATLDGKFITVNTAFARMNGYGSPDEIMAEVHDIGRGLHRHPGDREKLMELLKKEGVVFRFETEWKKKDGNIIPVILNARTVRDDHGNILYYEGAVVDVTEQKRLESQLRQSQKMEAIGTLAGGIAHDFNNLLMTMQGNTSLMMEDIDSSNPHYDYLKSMENQIRSAANLTRQLLGFAREGHYDMKPLDINEILEKTTFMFSRTRKEIQIHRTYGKDLRLVETDADQIGQVFMNLFVNAAQAMPGGGDLFLETKNVVLDETYVKPYTTVPGRYVKITVTDTGMGMDEKTMQRIFEPFFTTKERGQGTGLGLSMVYGIIKRHNGFINVYSEPGHGTTFTIYLPGSESDMEAAPDVSTAPAILRGTGTILLVDDETQVLKVSQRMLERLGYTVIAAQSGKEAVDLYRERKDEIDIVLLDMIMPEMSGEKVFQVLREMNPGVRVILLSGYSLKGQAIKILEAGCNGFLQKPASLSELSQKIHDVLHPTEV